MTWNILLIFVFSTGKEEGLWLHVDAAYAGAAFLCPELHCDLKGVDFSDSFVFNTSKWMTVHCDCAAFWWVRRSTDDERLDAGEINVQYLTWIDCKFLGSKINISSNGLSVSILLTSDMKIQRKQLNLWYAAHALHCNQHIMTVNGLSCQVNAVFCCPALAGGPQETVPFSETLVCYALLWTEKHSGSNQTGKIKVINVKYDSCLKFSVWLFCLF